MKSTGIVRRIDDLGRIVIPKEIRSTLRIRGGDPLEIYKNCNGEIVFKKYSPISELRTFATQYADTLSKTSGYAIFIIDKDNIIAVSGASKTEFADKKISPELEKIMEDKTAFISKLSDNRKVQVADGVEKFTTGIICPIISEGDSIGTVVFSSLIESTKMGEVEEKLAQSAAYFLGSQID